jgi:hypothetical protein
MKLLVLMFALTFLSASATAQTASDLNAKYGTAQNSYEIRPGIFATPKFAADGRTCEMTIEKRHVRASGTIDLDSTFLKPDETKPIIEELVPLNLRGNETKSSGDTAFIGGGSTTTHDYENVRIIYYGNVAQSEGGTAAVVIQWKNRGCN